MTEYRAKPGTLHMIGEVQHGQPWYHEADLPVKDMLHGKYFAAWRSEVRPGDTIRLVRSNGARVAELAEIMIIEVHADSIEHTQTRPIKTFPVKAADAPIEEPPEVYADRDGYTVEDRGAGWFAVKTPGGEVVAKTRSEEDAQAMRAGSMPLPIRAAA